MTFFARHKNDILLVMGAIVLAAAAWLVLHLTATRGVYAVVSVDGVEIGRYALRKEETVVIGGAGESNTLVISGGCAEIVAADCPDRICVRRGKISRSGETIVCLPHKLVVSITGGENAEIDAVAD